MTPKELAEFRELAGLNEPSTTEQQKQWADAQLNNQPKIENSTPPEQQINNSTTHNNNNVVDEVENIADRLNGLMRTPGKPPKQNNIQPKNEDKELENLSNKLNGLLGNNFKVERLQ